MSKLLDGRAGSVNAPSPSRRRILALDAHRGLAIVMLILVNSAGIREAMPYQLSHAEWHGLTFADTFFPVFLFAMGAAMEFSSRTSQPRAVARRVVLLFAFGVGLSWLRLEGFMVSGVLQKLAVAYLLAWVIMRLPGRWHPVAAIAILGVMWMGFSFVSAGSAVPGSYEPGTNFAGWLDTLVIGRPATEGFASTIMATVNVLGGAIVIRSVRELEPREALFRLATWAVVGIAAGLAMSMVVPINKRIWTPSFTVLTHGIAAAYLALFWWVGEVRRWSLPLRPMVSLGRNPIFIYVLFTAAHELLSPVRIPVAEALAGPFGATAASLIWSGTLTLIGWGLAEVLDRRRIYVKV